MNDLSLCKRLIEVDLPIRVISDHARREKSIRHGHISTLHLWWARRPLAACRAVLLAALCPDPADPRCPESFREAARAALAPLPRKVPKDPLKLRGALLSFIGDFANWDLTNQPDNLAAARALVDAAHLALGGLPGTHPQVLDPFAGGGAIPLEAARLGCEAIASDLNPVAVLLNKVQLEFIPRHGKDLAEAFRAWGAEVGVAAKEALKDLYPVDPDGAVPIAYLWARTIRCEGPGCGVEVPLIRATFFNHSRPPAHFVVKKSHGEVTVDVVLGAEKRSTATVKEGKAICPVCGHLTTGKSVRAQLAKRRGGGDDARLLAVVVSRGGERGVRAPNEGDHKALRKALKVFHDAYEKEVPVGNLSAIRPAKNTRGTSSVIPVGITTFADLHTVRQKVALVTLQKTIAELLDAKREELGEQYEPLRVLLAFAVSRMVNQQASLARWNAKASTVEGLFTKQALQIVWDFAECAPFAEASGSWSGAIEWIARVVEHCATVQTAGQALQADAMSATVTTEDQIDVLFTDPPYFAAIPYADLSDVFYVWLRKSLRALYPTLLAPETVDRVRELIVTNAAKGPEQVVKDGGFFRTGMSAALANARVATRPGGIGCVVFADSSAASWEALLAAVIDAGWVVTASWPIETERTARTRALRAASLSSSVFLICRPRENDDGSLRHDEVGDWQAVQQALPGRIAEWLPRLAAEGIVGADAIFACLGPALEIFSRYSRVERANGEVISLATYLPAVWGEIARQALSTVIQGAQTHEFEADARLTAIWLWTLSVGRTPTASGDDAEEDLDDDADDDEGEPRDGKKPGGFALEFDAARMIAMGLGVALDGFSTIVEVETKIARLRSVTERASHLFPKRTTVLTTVTASNRRAQQAFGFLEDAKGRAGKKTEELGPPRVEGTTLDRLHQAMILFDQGRKDALRDLLVVGGHGKKQGFWALAQSLSALYPAGSTEKRLVDGVLSQKKALGL